MTTDARSLPGFAPAAPPRCVTACAHCGQPSTRGDYCCDGCETVSQLLADRGLDDLTCRLSDEARPVSPSGRSYAELDTAEYFAEHVRLHADGSRETTVYLGDAHCAACVWLVEAVPQLRDGVLAARLDVLKRLATVRWDPSRTSLSAIAQLLDTLGYRVRPAKAGADARLRREEERQLLVRIGVAGATAGNVMLFALAMYSGVFGEMSETHTAFFRWASLLIGVPGTLWPAAVFLRGAIGSIRARRVHMDLPIAVGIAVGMLSGIANTLRDSGEIYFDTLATLTFLLLVGRWTTQRRAREAADTAARLLSLTPSHARRLDADGTPNDVLADALQPGDRVRVHSGEVVPCDGVVLSGSSLLDNAVLTGESIPVGLAPGEPVYAGSTNLDSPIEVEVSRAGAETRMGRLMADVEAMAARKAPMVLLADRWAARFVVVVLSAAAASLVVWSVVAGPEVAIEHVVALLVVTCPCALGLATPLAVTVAIGRAARAGLLIRGGDALEAAALEPGAHGTIFLDKTGTLTSGALRVVHHVAPPEVDAVVAAAEATTTHPIGRALVAALGGRESFVDASPADPAGEPGSPGELSVTTAFGGGLRGSLPDGRAFAIGSPRFVGDLGPLQPELERLLGDGATPVVARVESKDGAPVYGLYGLLDQVRPEAGAVVEQLRKRGWHLGILSGDDPRVVAAVGSSLGLAAADCRGGLLPSEKRAAVEAARVAGPVIMVGDGVNDAAALAAATVGLAVHGGAEASLLAADAFSARPGLEPLLALVQGADRTRRAIVRNLRLSSAYNAIGGALALLGLMNPLVAAVLMPFSSLSVIASSVRARTFTPPVAERTAVAGSLRGVPPEFSP